MLTMRIKPCPFCGRKMVFHNPKWIDKYGKQREERYWMHEEYDGMDECVLDKIRMPFTIGAGDARFDGDGNMIYPGEYAEDWNKRAPMQNCWVPVTERMPGVKDLKVQDFFLVTYSGNDLSYLCEDAVIMAAFDSDLQKWFSEDYDVELKGVSAWMSLPEPY